jgi:hypothetical protein
MMKTNSGLPPPDPPTSATLLIPRPRLTTGSTKTGNSKILLTPCRVWNEENRDYEIRRAQIYMLQGFVLGNYVLGVKTILTVVYN